MSNVSSNLNALLSEFKQHMEVMYGDRLAKVILYGSYARGDFHAESDVDFMVVLKDIEINRSQEIKRITPIVVSMGFDYQLVLSPILVPENRYAESDYLFFKNVRREGVLV